MENESSPAANPVNNSDALEIARSQQNLLLGALGGLSAMVVGTTIWVLITVATHYQIGYMAIGVGFLVGLCIRHAGKGIDASFQLLGATLALLGCTLGNLFTGCEFVAEQQNVSFFAVVASLNLETASNIMTDMFRPLDILFYILAISAGWKYSIPRHLRRRR